MMDLEPTTGLRWEYTIDMAPYIPDPPFGGNQRKPTETQGALYMLIVCEAKIAQ